MLSSSERSDQPLLPANPNFFFISLDATAYEMPPLFPVLRPDGPPNPGAPAPVLVLQDRRLTYRRAAAHVAVAHYISFHQRFLHFQV